LRRTRLEQKGGGNRRPGSSRDIHVHRLFCHLLGNFRTASEGHCRRDCDATERRARHWRGRDRRLPGQPMDRARLSTSRGPRLSPGQTRLLQLGRFVGRRSADRMGISGGGSVMLSGIGFQPMDESKHEQDPHATQARFHYFAEADGDGDADGAPSAGGLTSSNSTSKIKVEFGPISGPTARSP